MSFCIRGIGTAVPRQRIAQDDAARLAVELIGENLAGSNQAKSIHTLYRKAGVRQRFSTLIDSSTNGRPATQSFFPVANDDSDRGPTTADRMSRYCVDALDLAEEASIRAIRESGVEPHEITHLVTVSCTGFSAPGVDAGLIERLGLRRDVARTHVGFMGCHGALNGLRVAAAFGAASPKNTVLVCCVELFSIHHQNAADTQMLVANALFSDGAAAVVGSAGDSCNDTWRVVDQSSHVLPDTAHLMGWQIGNHGFEMCLSPRVPGVIKKTLQPWLSEWLSQYDLSVGDVRGWSIHPGGPRILTACAESLEIDPAYLGPSQEVLAEFGNMSSPTVLFILEQLRRSARPLPCIALAFGPGLTIEAALIWSDAQQAATRACVALRDQ
jgi:predicted naringenin-chalcone synthase